MKKTDESMESRDGETPQWEFGLNALQFQLKKKIHVGAKIALERKGLRHYIKVTSPSVYLILESKVAVEKWFTQHDWHVNLHFICSNVLPYEVGLEEDYSE